MKSTKPIYLSVLLAFLPLSASAQDCDALMRHGLRNIQISKSTEGLVATKYFNHCHKDFSSLSDSQLASAEVEVFGYGSGGGSFSRSQREDRLTDWCKTSKETAELNRSSYDETQNIYADALRAWEHCNQLKARDVTIEPIITPDGKNVEVTLRYTGATRSGVEFYGATSEGFTCTTTLPAGVSNVSPQNPIEIKNQAIAVACVRAQTQERTRDGESYNVVPRGVITVRTASFPMQLFFDEEWTPPIPRAAARALANEIEKQRLPVGTILAFAGPADRLPDGFLLCNGASYDEDDFPELARVIRGVYGPAVGAKFVVPNLMGRFPLGAGNGDGLEPRPLGSSAGAEWHTITLQQMPAHSHIQTKDDNFGAPGSGGNADGNGGTQTTGLDNGRTREEGSGQRFSLIPPYQSVTYVIKH